MKNVKLIFFLLIISKPILVGQPTNKFTNDASVPTPEAAALGKYADIPVNAANGTSSMNISLGSIKNGTVGLDVSLNYHLGGLRLSEMASWVGLGWSLNAGGAISRSVLGLPDDYHDYGQGYYYSGNTLIDPYNTSPPSGIPNPSDYSDVRNQVAYSASGAMDSEPDIFNFNVAGFNGKFLFKVSSGTPEIVQLSKSDVKISLITIENNSFTQFQIIAPDGTKYIFGSTTIIGGRKMGIEVTEAIYSSTAKHYNTTWYLTKIISPDDKYTINLDYSYDGFLSFDTRPTQVVYPYISTLAQTCGNGGNSNSSMNYNSSILSNTYYGWRLDKIYTAEESIFFISNTNREDLINGDRLDQIKFTANNNSFCKNFDFGYSYMLSSGTVNDNRKKRLILQNITEKSCDGTVVINPYTFSYNPGTLPERLSLSRDHWGYYNGTTANSPSNFDGIPPEPIHLSSVDPVYYQLWANGNRNTDENYAKIGVLNSVKYPTGGRREIDVESNRLIVTNCTSGSALISLFSLTTCTQPWPGAVNSDCCVSTNGTTGYRSVTGTYTHSNTSINKIRLVGYKVWPCGSNSFASWVGVTVFQNGVQIGNQVSLNVPGGAGNSASIEVPITDLFTPQLNQSYTIKLEGYEFVKATVDFGYTQVYNNCVDVDSKVGGLRSKEIRSYTSDNDNNPNRHIYKYYDGVLNKIPNYGGRMTRYDQQWLPQYLWLDSTFAIRIASECLYPLTNYSGNIVTYGSSIDSVPGEGKTKYWSINEIVAGYNGNFGGNSGFAPNHIPIAQEKTEIFDGELKKKEIYDNNNVVMASEEYLYGFGNGSGSYVNAYEDISDIMYKAESVGDNCLMSVKTYKNRWGIKRLISKKIIQDGIETLSTYEFDPTNRFEMPVSEYFTNSDGKVNKTEYTYVHDYSNTAIKTDLLNRNIISNPFKTLKKVDNVIVDGNETEYAWYNLATGAWQSTSANGYVRPYKAYRYEYTWTNNVLTGSGKTLEATFNSYDNYGNLAQITIDGWDPMYYEWFSNGLLKKNTFINHAKQYTYYPSTRLMATFKDIDNQTINYSYDKLSRLSQISARAGKVLTDYTYHYKENSGDIYNWVKTKTNYINTNTNSALTAKESKQIVDGLGRAIESISVDHSPNHKDIVIGKEYDSKGRLIKEYLPIESTYNNGTYVAIPSGTKFKQYTYEASPLNRKLSEISPSGFITSIAYGANSATDVFNLATNTNYAANLFSKETITDPNNNRSIVFKDKKGRQVLDWKTDLSYSNHAKTYSLYDNKDRLITVVPPSATLSTPNLIFNYTYDPSDNVLSKKTPDKNKEYFQYNTRNLQTFYQDGNLLAANKWLQNQYDAYGRMTKIGTIAMTAPTLPSGNSSYTYSEEFINNSYFTLATDGVKLGKLKQTLTKILGTSTWVETDFNYDAFGRKLAMTGSNHLNSSLSAESTIYFYDMADNITEENRNHMPSATETYSINNRMTYDFAGRLVDHFMALNGGSEQKISNQAYTFKDELMEKNLGAAVSGGFNTYLQSLDYTYNDEGWLLKINSESLGGTNSAFPSGCTPALPNPGVYNSAANPDPNDLFYLELKYDAATFPNITGLPTNAQKNGNIAQIAWRVRGRDKQAYNYTYDFLDRLTSASHYKVASSNAASYSNYYNESLTYDARGNINTLGRTGYYTSGTTCSYATIDNLTYAYNPNTNQLKTVTDNAVSTYKPFGFNPSSGGVGYGYDVNGNLKSDTYKGITNITYNHLNLPTKIEWGTTKSIEFTYDGSGKKLCKKVKTGTTTNYVQDYLDGIEYNSPSGTNRKIEAIYHAEGRFFNISATTTPSFRTEFTIKDHLGNARISFTDKNFNGKIDVTNNQTTNEILQENHYYAFGMAFEGPWMANDAAKDNSYKYNSKEYNDDHGLKWNDYGARWYDAAIGRFSSVDPLASKYFRHNPYNYGVNNPIRFIDPDGRKADDIIIKQKNGDQRQSAQRTFNMLQSLTSDKLSMDKNGNVTIAESGAGNANATSAGTKLVSNLIDDHSKTTTITNDVSNSNPKPNLARNAITTPDNGANAKNGKGTGSTIQFSPDVKATMETTNCDKVTASAARVLAHELAHAENNRTGTNERNEKANGDFNSNKEEQKAVQKENQMFKTQRYDGTNGNN